MEQNNQNPEILELKNQLEVQTLLNQLNDNSTYRMMLLQNLQQIAVNLEELKNLRELLEDYLKEDEPTKQVQN